MKKDILSLNLQELTNEIIALGQPKFRAKQIYRWLHKSFVTEFSQMSDLSLGLRELLNDNFVIFGCAIEKKLVSEYDNTVKYLFKLHDGEFIESVLMKYKYGYTVCVSSQVGCRMGCTFCASTLSGACKIISKSVFGTNSDVLLPMKRFLGYSAVHPSGRQTFTLGQIVKR